MKVSKLHTLSYINFRFVMWFVNATNRNKHLVFTGPVRNILII
jgi:hypothetical protein